MANRSILESDSRLYLDRRPRQFHPGDPGNVILRNIDKQVHLNRKIRYIVITLDHLDIFPIFLLSGKETLHFLSFRFLAFSLHVSGSLLGENGLDLRNVT